MPSFWSQVWCQCRHLFSGLSRLLVPKPGWNMGQQTPSLVRGEFQPPRPIALLIPQAPAAAVGCPARPAGRSTACFSPRVWGTHVGAVVMRASCGRADAMSLVLSRIPPLDQVWGRGQRAGLGLRSTFPAARHPPPDSPPPSPTGAVRPPAAPPGGPGARSVCSVVEMVTGSQLENDWPADLNVVPEEHRDWSVGRPGGLSTPGLNSNET